MENNISVVKSKAIKSLIELLQQRLPYQLKWDEASYWEALDFLSGAIIANLYLNKSFHIPPEVIFSFYFYDEVAAKKDIYVSLLHNIVREQDIQNEQNLLRAVSEMGMADSLGIAHQLILEKGNRRKGQGSYYTPMEVVDYMATQTLGRFLDDALTVLTKAVTEQNQELFNYHWQKVKNYRIIDPACGTGIFLVKLYTILFTFYENVVELVDNAEFYTKDMSRSLQEDVLTFKASIIIQRHIRGMDVDNGAVRLARLALYVHLMINTKESITNSVNNEELVKVLNETITQGNSLTNDLDGPCKYDLVIGNPPYISNRSIPKETKVFVNENYLTAYGQYDTVVPFIEAGVRQLKEGGRLGYIVSNKFLASDYGQKLRAFLLEAYVIEEIIDASSETIFAGASAYPVIITIINEKPSDETITSIVSEIGQGFNINNNNRIKIDQKFFFNSDQMIITTRINEKNMPILQKINNCQGRLGLKDISCGIAASGFGKTVVEQDREGYKQIIRAGDIEKYKLRDNLKYIPETIFTKSQEKLFAEEKLVIPGISKTLRAAYDTSGLALGRVYCLSAQRNSISRQKLMYCLGLLNSCVLNFYYQLFYWPVHLAGGFLRFNSTYLSTLPIPYWDTGSLLLESGQRIAKRAEKLCFGSLNEECRAMLEAEQEADIFQLYGLNEQDAQFIMEYLNYDAGIIETVRVQLRGNSER